MWKVKSVLVARKEKIDELKLWIERVDDEHTRTALSLMLELLEELQRELSLR